MPDKKKHIVVVGNGMTSLRFCEKLLEYDAQHEYRLTVMGEESCPAYDRVSLSSVFTDKTGNDLILSEARWYAYYKIDLRLGTCITAIDRVEQQIVTASGDRIKYDILILATGARPVIPPLKGNNLKGLFVYRTLNDQASIHAAGRTAKTAVVIGGGLLGLEAAEACRQLGLSTTIIEREPHLLACQLDPAGGQLLQSRIKALDLTVRTGTHVAEILGEGQVRAVRLKNNESLPADLVILAVGIQPNDELAQDAGITIGKHGGIAVNNNVRTSDSKIYAIGECASSKSIWKYYLSS